MGKRARKGSNETAAGQAASTVRGVNCKSLVLAFPGFGFRLCKCIMGRKQEKGRPCLSPPISQSVLQVMREDKKLEPQTEAETEEKANTHSLSACKYSFIERLLEMAGQSRGALCILDTVLRLRREIWTAGIHSLGGSLPQKANAYAIEGIMLSAASAYDIRYSVWLLQ